ncbi:MAG: zinc-ribbon domain-containing protein [Chloroflexia bacterium]|nr:zinc-ribbon domain-containing protein [Chloroflexia bacterium]
MAGHTLLSPQSAALDTVCCHSVRLLLGLLALYSVLTVGLWYVYEVRQQRASPVDCPSCGATMPSNAHFCTDCGQALPGRRPTSRRTLAMLIVLGLLWLVLGTVLLLS